MVAVVNRAINSTTVGSLEPLLFHVRFTTVLFKPLSGHFWYILMVCLNWWENEYIYVKFLLGIYQTLTPKSRQSRSNVCDITSTTLWPYSSSCLEWCPSKRKENLFGCVLWFQNIFILLNSSSENFDWKHVRVQTNMKITLIWRFDMNKPI